MLDDLKKINDSTSGGGLDQRYFGFVQNRSRQAGIVHLGLRRRCRHYRAQECRGAVGLKER